MLELAKKKLQSKEKRNSARLLAKQMRALVKNLARESVKNERVSKESFQVRMFVDKLLISL